MTSSSNFDADKLKIRPLSVLVRILVTLAWIPEVPRKTGPLVPRRQGFVPVAAAQPRFGIVICHAFLDN